MLDKDKNNNKNQPQTTGHDWDGVQEYNVPTPRWWLIVWIICIIWAFIYWIFYPAWPTKSGNSKGILNWSKQSELANAQKEIQAKKNVYLQRFEKSSFAEIKQDPNLLEFALNGGRAAFKENCAPCHGTGAGGGKGFPNLNDDNWIWGGKIDDIYTTIKYGVRSPHKNTRVAQMPAFGYSKLLDKKDIDAVADYVAALPNKTIDLEILAKTKGADIFKNNCASCHGFDAKGNQTIGATNLTIKSKLYGSSREEIIYTINYARLGAMPYFIGRLDDNTIRELTIYIHSLGGGQ